MYKTYTREIAGRILRVDVGRVAAQANGAVFIHYGDTSLVCTATASEKPRDGIDFFPLSVEYEEKLYSVGKIPGGYIKREGKPTENAVLTSRVIDRPMRPLFPKDYRNDVLLNNLVMCVDPECSPELVAMWGSSIATFISDIPFNGPVASTIVGMIDDKFIINPTLKQKEESVLNLTVASTKEKIIMIEAGADEISEEKMLEAIFLAHEQNKELIDFFEEIQRDCGKEKHDYEKFEVNKDLYNEIVNFVTAERMEDAVFTDDKQTRSKNISKIKEELEENYSDNEEILSSLDDILYKFEKETVRKMILKDKKRPDGRKIDEIRKLYCEIDLLKRTHGSAMFTRGQTQAITITTLGPLSEIQRLDGLDENEVAKRYMHHYNFPGYSVGEAKPQRAPGRREIGHGALAERALVPVIPKEEEFPYAIRTVSEIMESNGSTSQASICASTLSLMAAGVPIKNMVAGISVGLVTDETSDDYVILTDIQGLEDFFGDMDFKVAGSEKGITAIQMDIKIDGLTEKIIRESIERTKEARMYILNDIMKPVIDKPREKLSDYAPKIKNIQIDVAKIGDVVGQKGKTINAIIEKTGVKIDISETGFVSVYSDNEEKTIEAIEYIRLIATDIEKEQHIKGVVTDIKEFGAIVEFAPGKDALIHIGKISKNRLEHVEDVLTLGDKVEAVYLGVDKQKRPSYCLKEYYEEVYKKNKLKRKEEENDKVDSN